MPPAAFGPPFFFGSTNGRVPLMPKNNFLRGWLPVCLLGLSSFIHVTSEFMPVGLLPDIARSIGETEAITGRLLTGYAWIVALVSLPLTLLTAHMERRHLLVLLLGTFVIGNFLCSLAQSFYSLFACRLVIAFAHAVFWSVTPALAVRLSPKGKHNTGLAIVSGGAILATVLGVPVGTALGHQMGWRATFIIIALLAAGIVTLLRILLPKMASSQAGSLRTLPAIFHNKTLLAAYAVTACLITGNFTLFTYLVPFLTQVVGVAEGNVSTTLFVFGISGVLGVWISSVHCEKKLRRVLLGGGTAALLMLAATSLFHFSFALVLVCLIGWSVAQSMLGLAFQSWVLRLAPETADAAMSLYSGIFNLGIGSGALLGSLAMGGIGLPSLGYVGAVCAVPALLLLFFFAKTIPSTAEEISS